MRVILISFLTLLLVACAGRQSPADMSYLQQGKRNFEAGYYRRAKMELLPYACAGDPSAQYAIGYMYYYGYGVAQDTDVGYFWIKRAADQNYPPAVQAVNIIAGDKVEPLHARDRLKANRVD